MSLQLTRQKQCVLQDEENHHWQDAVITSEQEDWSGRASWYLAVCWQAPVGCATLICTSAQEWIPRGLPCAPLPYQATSCLPKLGSTNCGSDVKEFLHKLHGVPLAGSCSATQVTRFASVMETQPGLNGHLQPTIPLASNSLSFSCLSSGRARA